MQKWYSESLIIISRPHQAETKTKGNRLTKGGSFMRFGFTPTSTPTRFGLVLIAAGVFALAGLAGGALYSQRKSEALVSVAQRMLSLELNLGETQDAATLSLSSGYRPFRKLVVPGSQAALYTRAMLNQYVVVESGRHPLIPRAAHWWTAKPPSIKVHHGYTTVVLSVYWWKKFSPAGETSGQATISVNLQPAHAGSRNWQVNGVFWNLSPSSGPDAPDSFAYHLNRLTGVPTPPEGDPPPLKPRVSNP
jgi:hypothetical protein